MPLVVPTDIAAAFIVKWAATSALNTIIPSTSVYTDRVGENVAYPYCSLKPTEDSTETTSGPNQLTYFRLELAAYTNAQPAVAGTLAKAIMAAFVGTSTDGSAGLVVSDGTVLDCRSAAGGSVRQTPMRKDGKDVVRTAASFRILVTDSRG